MATAIITGEMLKPCPFCGGEAHTRQLWSASGSGSGYLYSVSCPTEGCYGHDALAWYELPRDAAEAWNRRAGRTCRVEVERRKLSQTQTAVVKSCSGCGFEFGVEKEDTFPFEVTLNAVVPPNFCPNCGAKVEP